MNETLRYGVLYWSIFLLNNNIKLTKNDQKLDWKTNIFVR